MASRRKLTVAKTDTIPTLRPAPAPKPALAPADRIDVMDAEECPQGSPEWFQARLGLPTASTFGAVMAQGEGKMRSRLMRRLAGEIITGEPAEGFTSAAMERGKAMEAEARAEFAFVHPGTVTEIGFVKRTVGRAPLVPLVIGASPDSLIDDDGVLEIKTMMPELMIELAESGRFPTEHRAQCQGALWVTGRQYTHLRIFYRGMPTLKWDIERDDSYIAQIREAVEAFDYELRKLVERIRSMA